MARPRARGARRRLPSKFLRVLRPIEVLSDLPSRWPVLRTRYFPYLVVLPAGLALIIGLVFAFRETPEIARSTHLHLDGTEHQHVGDFVAAEHAPEIAAISGFREGIRAATADYTPAPGATNLFGQAALLEELAGADWESYVWPAGFLAVQGWYEDSWDAEAQTGQAGFGALFPSGDVQLAKALMASLRSASPEALVQLTRWADWGALTLDFLLDDPLVFDTVRFDEFFAYSFTAPIPDRSLAMEVPVMTRTEVVWARHGAILAYVVRFADFVGEQYLDGPGPF